VTWFSKRTFLTIVPWAVAAGMVGLGPVAADNQQQKQIFGPKTYKRTTGAPNRFEDKFTVAGPLRASYVLRIVNGDERGGHRVSSATVTLNGADIVVPRNLSQQVGSLDLEVTLKSSNTLKVTLASAPGSYLSIGVAEALPTPPQNRPPIVNAGPDQAITLPAAATLDGSVTDDGLPARSGLALTSEWSKVTGPGAVTFANRSTPKTTAGFDAPGTYVLRLTAHDGELPASDDLTITVNPAPPQNMAPVVTAGGSQTITLPAPASLSGSVSDDGLPAGAAVTSTWTKTSGPGAVAFANAASPATTATFDEPGAYVLRLTASDTQLTTFAETTITVNSPAPTNQPPAVSAGADQTVTLPAPAALSGSVSDDGLPAGAAVTSTWTKTSGPGAVAFANAASPATTATFDEPGAYVLRLTASDTELTAFAETAVTVNSPPPTNQPPAVNAGANQTVTLPAPASLSGSVSDDGLPAGAAVASTWTKTSGPGAVAFANAASPATTATFDEPGAYVLRLTASDTELTAFAEIAVVVNPATPVVTNRPPIVSAGANQTAPLGAGVVLRGTVADDGLPAGAPLTVAWSRVSGPEALHIANSTSALTSASFHAAGTYVLRLSASDSMLTAASDTTVIIEASPPPAPANQAPSVNAGPNQHVTLPATASLAGLTSDDGLPAGTLQRQWSQLSGPGIATFANAGADATTVAFTQPGHYVLRLTATDSALSAVSDVIVTAIAANAAPAVNAGPDASIELPINQLTLSGTALDDGLPDGSALTVSWSLVTGPAPVAFANTAIAATTATFNAPGLYVLKLRAFDSERSAEDDIAVTVVAAPIAVAPSANIGGPYSGQVGQLIAFDARTSADPLGEALSFVWDFGDGTTAIGGAPTHIYASANNGQPFLVRLEVKTPSGRLGRATTTATIAPIVAPVAPPVADPGGPYAGVAGRVVEFNGSRSSDPENRPLALEWDFGDGTTAQGTSPRHVYNGPAASGHYLVTLTVRNAQGGVDTKTTTATIATLPAGNRAPVARPGGPYSAVAGQAVSLTGSTSSDADGDALTFEWTFGDAQIGAGVSIAHTYTEPGTYIAALTATDAAGARNTATTTVTVAPAGADDGRPTARPGGPYSGDALAPLAFDGRGSRDPDGDTLVFVWDFGDGNHGSGATPTHTYAAAGTYTVSLIVDDGHGHGAQATTSATIGAPIDRSAPVVGLTAPVSVLPGTRFTVEASATDGVAVSAVTFSVTGSGASTGSIEDTAAPFEVAVEAGSTASPGSTIAIRATARDAAGNTAEAAAVVAIVSAPDTTAPVVTLKAPSEGSPGATIVLTAVATDDVGVGQIEVTTGGDPIGARAAAAFQTTYTIPQNAAFGTSLAFAARARDLAGNSGEAEASVVIVPAVPQSPPVVALNAQDEASAGEVVRIMAVASDARGVASVEFFVDGALLTTATSTPYEASFTVPATRRTGSVLRVRARAMNRGGLTAEATGETRIVAAKASASGVAGRVYDDTTSLPVAGATARLIGTDADGRAYAATAVSDARGHYFLPTNGGTAIVEVAKSGWTGADRHVVFQPGKAPAVFDARLTPHATAASVAAILGGTVVGGSATLTIPAGALGANSSVSITPVGQQGVAGLLPAGWSPIAVADVSPHAVTFGVLATIEVAPLAIPPAGSTLVLAAWDSQEHGWRAVGTTVASLPMPALTTTIAAGGQYAWLAADTLPATPPMPPPGSLLDGATLAAVPDEAAITITPSPKIAIYKTDFRAAVGAVLATPSPLPSGTPVVTRISEVYRSLAGGSLVLEPFVEGLVLYQHAAPANRLAASWTVTPSVTLEAADLRDGVIAVEVLLPGAAPATNAGLIGTEGGTVSIASGERADVPAAALATTTTVDLVALNPTALGLTVAPDLEIVGAVSIAFAGSPELLRPVVLSVPRPASVASGDLVLVLRLDDILGATRLVMAGVGRMTADRIFSDATVPGVATPLESVRRGGRYLFARARVPLGFATGTVLAPSGEPLAGAVISADTLPIVARSYADRAYALPARVGPVAVNALDPARADAGAAHGALANAGDVTRVDIQLLSAQPGVVAVSPAHAEENVAPGLPVVVTFATPLDAASLAAAAPLTLTAESTGTAVAGAITLDGGNRRLTFRPAAPLAESTQYRVEVSGGLRDVAGRTMPAPFTSRFTSLDTTPPAPPAAGAVTAGVPDADGFVTVTATQGTATPRDRVRVYNLRTNTFQTALVAPNGSFSLKVAARPGDALRLTIIDPAENQTSIDLPSSQRQVNGDGSVSAIVGIDGGRIDGPEGIQVDVPGGAFETPAVVTIKAIPHDALPVKLTAEQQPFFTMARGFALDFGGATPATYLNVSFPAGPNDTDADRWVVAGVTRSGDEDVLAIADTARIIDGRITTSSPPCPGIEAANQYQLIKPNVPVGLTYFSTGSSLADPIGTIAFATVSGLQSALSGGVLAAGGLSLPWKLAAALLPTPACLPTLAGRASIVPARQLVVIGADQIRPTDRELVVHNNTNGIEYRFPRNLAQFEFAVNGSFSDTFRVTVVSGGAQKVVRFDKRPGPPGKVDIKVDMDQVHSTVTEIVIENLTVTPPAVTRIPQPNVLLRIPVTGGTFDSFTTNAIDANGVPRPVARSIAALDAGNLVLKVRAGIIDPGATVTLRDTASGEEFGVPSNYIVEGGISYAFQGNPDHQYELNLTYTDGTAPERTAIPRVQISIVSRLTGRVLRTMTVHAPPHDEPYNLGILDPGTPRPSLIQTPSPLSAFDPSHPLQFRFSTGISRSSALAGFKVFDTAAAVQTPIAGEIRLTEQNTVLTFVPAAPLKIGATYRISMAGLADGLGRVITDIPLTLRTFEPLQAADNPPTTPQLGWASNVVLRRVAAAGGSSRTLAYRGNQLSTESRVAIVDVTSVTAPVIIGQTDALPASSSHRVALVTDVGFSAVAPSLCGSHKFDGDLLVDATSSDSQFGSGAALHFFDVTNPGVPCLLSTRLVSLPPSVFGSPHNTRRDVYAGGGAKDVAALRTAAGATAYAAITQVGIVAVDVASTITGKPPSGSPLDRPPLLPGDYASVVTAGDLLLAPESTLKQLHLVDPSLAVLSTADLSATGVTPRHVAYAPAFPLDFDNNGTVETSEQRDLALVSGLGGVVIVDISNPGDPSVIGKLGALDDNPATAPEISSVAADRAQRRIYALGALSPLDAGERILVFDLSGPDPLRTRDGNGDGLDDRLIWQSPQGTKVGSGDFAFALDADRGLLFVDYGNDAWSMVNVCCDLGVELVAPKIDRPTGDGDALLKRELAALKQEIAAGLHDAASCGVPVRPASVREHPGDGFLTIIEQGSGACLWKANPVAACHNVYVPGVSDHDFEVFVPKDLFATASQCVVKALSARFENANGSAKPIAVPGGKVTFPDLTFFPVPKEGFETGVLDLLPPAGAGSDPTGDLGLGRQQLLLKWLLEGEYITVPGFNLKGETLDRILAHMRAGAGIPRLEGLEWATLQRYNLAKAQVLLRVPGSSGATHALHDFYLDQLHDAGKAGIRAALARMVEDVSANQHIVATTRAQYASSACLDIRAGSIPSQWFPKPCTSFEEFIASAAGHRSLGANPLFTPAEVVNTIHRFYRVKADRERIAGDRAAGRFVAESARFVTRVIADTQATWLHEIEAETDPVRKQQRVANRNSALVLTGKANFTSLHVVPRVFNHSFRTATEIDVVMYRGAQTPGAAKIKPVRIDFDPAQERFLDRGHEVLPTPPDGITPQDRNLNDISRHDPDRQRPIFLLGDPDDPVNRPITLDGNFNTPGYVSFTIDLPGRTAKEPNRHNNYAGFWFYVIDPDNVDDAPTLPPHPPFPLLDPSLLQPNAECVPPADLRVTQSMLISDPGLPPEEFGDQYIGQPGGGASMRVRVANESGKTLTNVKACPSVLADIGTCLHLGTLAPGDSRQEDVSFVLPRTSQIFDATTTATAPELGARTSAPLRIVVGCEPYAVVTLPDDPNPDPSTASDIMRGGWAMRYYRVVDFNTGRPIANAQVTIDVTNDNGGHQQLTQYFTDADGYVQVPELLFKPLVLGNPLEPFTKGFAIHVDPSTPIGTRLTATLSAVNGVAPYCAGPQTFQLRVTDRSYQRAWKVGASIGAAGTVELGLQGKAGGSLTVTMTDNAATGHQLLSVARSENLEAGLLASPLKNSGTFDIGKNAQFAVKLDVGVLRQGNIGDQYDFKFEPGGATLKPDDSKAFGAIVLRTLLGEGPVLAKFMDVLRRTSLNESAQPNKTSETIGLGWEVNASTGFSIVGGNSFDKVFTDANQTNRLSGGMNIGTEASLGAGGKFGMLGTTTFNPQTKEVTSGYELRGSIDLTAALGIGPGEAGTTEDAAGKLKRKVKLIGGIKAGIKGTPLAETFKIALTRDGATDLKATKLAVSVATAKNFGFSVNVNGTDLVPALSGGDKTTFKFTISDPAGVAQVASHLPTLRATRVVPAGVPLAVGVPIQIIGPIVAAAEMITVVNAVDTVDADFDVSVEDGVASVLPFTLEGTLLGIGAKFSMQASLDKTITWTAAKGKVKKGKFYPLENYFKDALIPNPAASDTDQLKFLAESAFSAWGQPPISQVFDIVTAPIATGIRELRSRQTASLLIDGTNEPPFDAGLLSFQYTPENDARGFPQRPLDVSGRGDRPHYGIGGFHQFLPRDKVLANPAPLTIFYKDDEVAGLDEASMAIYRWNDARGDWDHLGGVVDRAANTVRVTVDRFGLYTAAPVMPAGLITFTAESTPGGDALNPHTTVSYTSAAIRTNTGQIVPDGTPFTVYGADAGPDATSFGTVLTADADPAVDGVQVTATGGVIRFAVDYPAAGGVAVPFAFAVDGTAISKDPLPLRPQP
jgi:PKD repeat protein